MTDDQARRIGCLIVLQAYSDAKNNHEYKRDYKNYQRDTNKADAIQFFGSEWFKSICCALRLPTQRIKEKALNEQ